MISVLIPTRKRPDLLFRTVHSLRDTARGPVQVVCYIDDDDPESEVICQKYAIEYVKGPRITLSDCWNKCLRKSLGDIFMQGNDDLIFRTSGWDLMVENAFDAHPDGILFVHGSDLNPHRKPEEFGTHGFVHRRWVQAVGYFIPPYFASDYGDTWLNEVANELGRRRFIPFEIEHMHYSFGKMELDDTARERLARHKETNPEKLWEQLAGKRLEDVQKLRERMFYKETREI